MKPLGIINTVGKTFSKTGMTMKKHAPEILVTGGVAGVVTSAVLACRATLHLNDVLTDAKKELAVIHQRSGVYQPEDNRKEVTAVYVKTSLRVAKLYLPSVGLGAASIASILSSHNILQKRNAGLAAAYALIDTSFKQYRARVVDRFGNEVDSELLYDTHDEKIEKTIVDENGKTKKVKETVKVSGELSGYARYYDHATSEAWEESNEYNLFYLRGQQAYANNLLSANGYLFLNDVYKMLGIQRSVPGQAVGWVFEHDGAAVGDNYVDFGIKETYRKNADGVLEPVILLDFNVDGNIWERAAGKALISE